MPVVACDPTAPALVLFGELPLTPACAPPWLDWAKAAELAKTANAPTNRSFLMVFSMFMGENNPAPLLTFLESYANHVAVGVADALGRRRNRPAEPLGKPRPRSYFAGMFNTVVRIFKHEESFEVRVSTFFYFDDHPGQRSITKRMKPEEAEAAAKAYAKVQRGDGPPPPKP